MRRDYDEGQASISLAAGTQARGFAVARLRMPSDRCARRTCNHALVVASTNIAGNLSAFSDYGPYTVALGAPGTGILSTVPGDFAQYISEADSDNIFYEGFEDAASAGGDQIAARAKESVSVREGLTGRVATNGLLDLSKAIAADPADPGEPETVDATWPLYETDLPLDTSTGVSFVGDALGDCETYGQLVDIRTVADWLGHEKPSVTLEITPTWRPRRSAIRSRR